MVEQEVRAAPPAAASERLRQVTEERQRWMVKRCERLARKNELLKLLELEAAKKATNGAKGGENEAEKANREERAAGKNGESVGMMVQARKKELRELQERAKAAKEKQEQAASALVRNLKQLKATKDAAQLGNTHRSPTMKRKRDEETPAEQPKKKAAAVPTVSDAEMPPFTFASDLDVGTSALAAAACFRIAMRYFTVTGSTMSIDKLAKTFKAYTGIVMDDAVDQQVLELSLACVKADGNSGSGSLTNFMERRFPERWQPGRQFLDAPTFFSSSGDRIQALIEVERQTVIDVFDSLDPLGQHYSNGAVYSNRCRQAYFLSSLQGDVATLPDAFTLSALLAACVGVHPVESTTASSKISFYLSHREISGALIEMEAWLRKQAENSELIGAVTSSESTFPLRHTKPFSLRNDSVVQQLRGTASLNSVAVSAPKKLDPMKIFCHYELNGVCKDKNCSFYHRKDYERITDELNTSNSTDDPPTGTCLNGQESNKTQQLLLGFAEFRARIVTKWPVITTTRPPSMTIEPRNDVVARPPDPFSINGSNGVVPGTQASEEVADANCSDFLALDAEEPSVDSSKMQSDARYFEDINAAKAYQETLQKRMEDNPTDVDGWLLLAISQLELETGGSDDAVGCSNSDARLQQQLVLLCRGLNMRQLGSPSRGLNVEEEALKRCLHTLSRAVEVEANAYCEALWLLYLHLCGHLTNKQTEIETVEQAVQFLPRSRALWFRYISAYNFDSVTVVKELHWRILHHLANVDTAEDGPSVSKSVADETSSILLSTMSLHLCIKLWRAGETEQVLPLLSALLQLGDTSSDYSWCDVVNRRLCSNEIIGLCMIFCHVVIFDELPTLIESWIGANSCKSFPVEKLAYSVEYFQRRQAHKNAEIFARAAEAYKLAFHTFENDDCREMRGDGDVILNNWVLLVAYQGDDNAKRDETINEFFKENLSKVREYPAASLTAAKVLGLELNNWQKGGELMITMMKQSSATQFPKALHHFLFASRQNQFSSLFKTLDKMFQNVMERLASLVGEACDMVDTSIQDFYRAANLMAKKMTLKALLERLLTAWMNQLASLRCSSSQPQGATTATADVYIALDICQLMGVMLEPSVAIDSLQLIMSAAKFGTLSFEDRQLVWMQRFVFELDLLQRDDAENLPWRQNQVKLSQLFQRYLDEMSVEAEMLRRVSSQFEDQISRNAIQDAVYTCLYPERSNLITYDTNMELFGLCLAAVAASEKATFYSSCTDALSLAPDFSIGFSDIAIHDWELVAARATLRKCLAGPKSTSALQPQVLQALVAVELRLRNMKMVSGMLESALQKDPLLLEAWRLVMGLEILFGEKTTGRAEAIAKDIERRHLVLACNTYGDTRLSQLKMPNQSGDSAATSLTLRGIGLRSVPNSVLLQTALVSLNLSGNKLTNLPVGLCNLNNLEKLDASENALVEFPACIKGLSKLKELALAHNNLRIVSTADLSSLSSLEVLDIRWNAVSRLPAASVTTLKKLKLLRAEENLIPAEDLAIISHKLSCRAEAIVPQPEPQAPSSGQGTLGSKKSEDAIVAATSGAWTELPVVEVSGKTKASTITGDTAPKENEMTPGVGDGSSESREADGDLVMDQKDITVNNNAQALTEYAIMEEADAAIEPKESNTKQIADEDSTVEVENPAGQASGGVSSKPKDATSTSKEDGGGQIMDQSDIVEDQQSLPVRSPNIESRIERGAESNEDKGGHIVDQEGVIVVDGPETQGVNAAPMNAEHPTSEVIDISNTETFEEGEVEAIATDEQSQVTSGAKSTTINSESVPSTTDGSSSERFTEAFAQNHDKAAVAAAARNRSSHEGATVALRKIAAYMEESCIGNRAEVRERNSALWLEFVSASLPLQSELGPCRLCKVPNDGRNQRFNGAVLCVDCLKVALQVVQMRGD